jgi:hypothetical protein
MTFEVEMRLEAMEKNNDEMFKANGKLKSTKSISGGSKW